MKKSLLFTLAALMGGTGFVVHADNDYDDDIYFNPNKAEKDAEKKAKSNYIKDFASIDVDEYNRRGQYYVTPVDTIGEAASYGEDFVYTQQIQKYINPTIVIDNADVLADVLANSYGNVEIVIDNGIPYFAPVATTFWPSYYYSYAWSPAWAWGWPSWSWSWGWGPSWAWGPSWSWGWGPGWGPSWNWGWGWGPGRPPHGGWGHDYYADHYRPNAGRRPFGPSGANWASNTRPSALHPANGVVNGRPGTGSSRPGSVHQGISRPGNNYSYTSAGHRIAPGVSVNRNPSTGTSVRTPDNRAINAARPAGSVSRNLTIGTTPSRGTSANSKVTTRPTNRNSSTSTQRSATTRNTYNSNNNSSRSRSTTTQQRSYNSGSSRSSGGSFGGSRSSGGGGGHRSGSGGGGRR